MAGTQSDAAIQLTHCTWQAQQPALSTVRCAVFVAEQGVPKALELDGHDEASHHVLATDPSGRPVGVGRIQADGHIGRMAVLKDCRGQGIGTAIMLALLDYAHEHGYRNVFLSAQTDAVGFYQPFGFVARGEVFEAAGIPHQLMKKSLL